MASAAGAIAILGEIANLEPIAFALVASLVRGLQGKSDAEVLAADSTALAEIIATAQQEAKS
jgi:hypothetical protein